MAEDLGRSVRLSRYPHIELRETTRGPQAHLLSTGLRVWQLIKSHRSMGGNLARTADYFALDPAPVELGLRYSHQ